MNEQTCSASRHAMQIAEALIAGVVPTDDLAHCGESIKTSVDALWAARSEIVRLRAEVEVLRDDLK